jgi:hypothetical protein
MGMTPATQPKDQKQGSQISESVQKHWRSEQASTVSSLGMTPLEFEQSSALTSKDAIARLKDLAKKIKESDKASKEKEKK